MALQQVINNLCVYVCAFVCVCVGGGGGGGLNTAELRGKIRFEGNYVPTEHTDIFYQGHICFQN